MWKFGAITGTIVDEAGDPVVGTRVAAMPRMFVAGRRRVTPGPTATTDDRGMFRIAGLDPGAYVIMVPSVQTTVPTEVMESFFSGTPITDAKRVELGREFNLIGSAIAPAGSQFAMKAGSQTFSLPAGTLTPIVSATGIMIYPTTYYPAAASAGQAAVITLRSGEERSGIDLQVRPVRGVRVSGSDHRARRSVGHDRCQAAIGRQRRGHRAARRGDDDHRRNRRLYVCRRPGRTVRFCASSACRARR